MDQSQIPGRRCGREPRDTQDKKPEFGRKLAETLKYRPWLLEELRLYSCVLKVTSAVLRFCFLLAGTEASPLDWDLTGCCLFTGFGGAVKCQHAMWAYRYSRASKSPELPRIECKQTQFTLRHSQILRNPYSDCAHLARHLWALCCNSYQ